MTQHTNNRVLDDAEQAALQPLIARRNELDQRRADVQAGIDAVLAMIFGRPISNVQATMVDGRMVLVTPEPVALVEPTDDEPTDAKEA